MITCPECGHPNDPFRSTCERCGAQLSGNRTGESMTMALRNK